jgi:molybdenum cofactor cytidylyltransferase
MNPGHAAIVLAAGGSRRLGRAKQLLTRDGETLVHRAVRLAIATGAARVVLVTGADHERIAEAVAGLKVEVAFNPRWESGLASSLQLAAHALRLHAGHVLILGCDQPALEDVHLQRLLAGAATAASGCAATQHADRLGSPAVLAAALPCAADRLQGDRGFGAYLNALAPDTVWHLHAPELQLDIDSPENEQAAIARGLLDASNVPA